MENLHGTPLPTETMESRIEHLFATMTEDYARVSKLDIAHPEIVAYRQSLYFEVGSVYIKLLRGTDRHATVDGFIVARTDDKKFLIGDLLKPAGAKGPARNFRRGNVFDPNVRIRWCGL